MASEIRVNSLTNRSGLSTVTIADTGVVIAGMVTATDAIFTGDITATSGTFSGNVSIGGTLTYEDVTNIDSVGIITARAGVKVPDNQKIFLGTDSDLEIYHDGSNARIKNTTGQLWLQSDNGIRFVDSDVNESTARFTDNGAVELYYDGTKKFETTANGIEVSGDQVLDGHLDMRDSDRIRLGASDELQIFHNGTHNFIDASGSTTDLYVRGANILLQDHANSNRNWLIGLANGALRLHHAGNLKLETTSAGLTIHEDTDKTISFTGGIGEIGNVTGFQALNSAGSALVDFGMRANTLRFATGSAERVRIDSSGCVRVGNTHSQTTSGNTKRIALGAKASIWGWTSGNINGALTLADNYYWDGANNRAIEADDAAYLSLRSGSLRFGTTDSTPSAGGVTGLTEKLRITSDGLLQIGTSTTSSFPDRLLSVGHHTRTSSYIDIRSSTIGGLLFADGTSGDAAYRGQVDYAHSSDELRLWTAATVRMRVSSVGRIRFPNVPGVAGSNLSTVYIESDGNLCTTTSVRAAKTNISPLDDTSWLYNLNPVTFNWRTKTENEDGTLNWGEEADGGIQYGLIAEEVKEVKDDFCYYNNDGVLTGIHYDRLIAPLLKVVQQQKEEIESLKARVTTLEG